LVVHPIAACCAGLTFTVELLALLLVLPVLPLLPMLPVLPLEPVLPLAVVVVVVEVGAGATGIAVCAIGSAPTPQPARLAQNSAAALSTIEAVLLRRCRRKDTTCNRVECILGLGSELDL
jgi:hypothetical protein